MLGWSSTPAWQGFSNNKVASATTNKNGDVRIAVRIGL
jgi:hypothetical protein